MCGRACCAHCHFDCIGEVIAKRISDPYMGHHPFTEESANTIFRIIEDIVWDYDMPRRIIFTE